jgi:hypothetical protein
LRRAVALLLALAASLPLVFVLGFATAPFWGWFEARTGIESLGHSGPADWCFGLLLALAWTGVLLAFLRRRHH